MSNEKRSTMPQGPDPKAIPTTRLQSMGMDDLIYSVQQTLETLSRWGCNGFSCSDQTLMKLNTWTASATAGPQKESLDHIHAELGACKRCTLSHHRKHILYGHGSPSADLVFVGQMPSMEEDQNNRFYLGPAGQLLRKMIGAMNLTREQVYICNVLKCSGPAKPSDINTCLPFLKRQLAALEPKVICTLGQGPSQILLDQWDSIESLRGRFYNYGHGKIMPTLDPALLMAHPEDKGKVWGDLKKIMAYLSIPL